MVMEGFVRLMGWLRFWQAVHAVSDVTTASYVLGRHMAEQKLRRGVGCGKRRE
jgi:hypothetical protein